MSDLQLTEEQRLLVNHREGAFVEACPGAGKTRTIVSRVSRIMGAIAPRKGVAVLSFTNSAMEEFTKRCGEVSNIEYMRHPGFVGTFDSFLRQFFISPCGISATNARPTVVDSWKTLGIEIRLSGQAAFRGSGVSLDAFDPVTHAINPDSIGHAGLREHVRSNLDAYQRNAGQSRRRLKNGGHLTAADVRIEVVQRLTETVRANALGRALAARFEEIIVDEAQDCNPLDIQILSWLRGHGVPVTIVADLDQAIYGFRNGTPGNLRAFAETYEIGNRLTLSGNFRSTPSVCGVAASLRARPNPDVCLGENAMIELPVHILFYPGASVPAGVSAWFLEQLNTHQIKSTDAVVLAHGRRVARRACGLTVSTDAGGNSRVAEMARAVGEFRSPSASNRARESAMNKVERLVLDLVGKIEIGESVPKAVERNSVDRRWLRRTSMEVLSRLPQICEGTGAGRAAWLESLRSEIERHNFDLPERVTVRSYLRAPTNDEWSRHLRGEESTVIRCATIHEVKGKEYGAVCVVIPPDQGGKALSTQLLAAWEGRIDDEAKRVVYVGVTRAEKLLCMAIPLSFRERVTELFRTRTINSTFHDLTEFEAIQP